MDPQLESDLTDEQLAKLRALALRELDEIARRRPDVIHLSVVTDPSEEPAARPRAPRKRRR